MFKIQYRNSQGRMVTATTANIGTLRRYVMQATSDVPDVSVSQIRIQQVVMDEMTGDVVWADCTADFTR
ncbi:hypothetical protein [Streptomyces sp. NRRL S-146]|uniref:hypothetical protein n=1 Tax=Streptomyces sp. NRRL S-146 TaxID=1463884 RepID=UPI0004C5B149|nr:hypothetical protein [Streptomyces sp. NRRL S-146]